MNFHKNMPRFQSPKNIPRNPNNFTFKNHATTPRQRTFIRPPTTSKSNGIPNGLKTPIISSSSLFGITNNESLGCTAEVMDHDTWDDFFETNENATGKQRNVNEHRNSRKVFPYPRNDMEEENRFGNNNYNSPKSNPPSKYLKDPIKKTPLRQTILSTETSKGLGYKINEKEKTVLRMIQENIPKPCPKWNPTDSNSKQRVSFESKDQAFPRIFSVTVDKLLSCPKVFDCGKVIFELFGILERVWDSPHPKAKKIQLKNQKSKNNLTCLFYEIDRVLPKLVTGQWHRCIILFRGNEDYQCITIRSATANELKYLDELVITSSKAMALLLKTSK